MRVKQISLAKILVKLHGRPALILVSSHIKLGSAYLDYKCLDQAYDHLKLGYEKNKEFKSNLAYERNRDKEMNQSAEENQMWVLQLLAQTCLQTHKLREALSYIEQACELCETSQPQSKFNKKSSHYAVLCEFKGDYYYLNDKLDQAMMCFEDAFMIYSELNQRHEGAANALRQIAKIYEVQGKYDVALESLGECIVYTEEGDSDNKCPLLIELLFKKIEILGF
jgi:tetratricopeptide (TPR) repeat protein